ncbi:bifunctional diguanylate cyclase/phosphodiesterase [Tumebacillus flagellatus]|uniref:PAS domain-containing protein n=1 Tax=Tumebacillus flagellatus TaxID=1157490 RepID=A0A074M5I3_9BACL|nr:EAL domain-containing protein [Tumebacillus flagellatus]KEO81252.1 hypothetical protein EL26_21870 [Tumebacillus flagellatus]
MDVIQRTYHMPLVTLSILIAIIASYTAFDLASRVTASRGVARRIWLGAGAITMGTGVWSMHFVAMHYTGMKAMRMPAEITYQPPLFLLSVAIAAGASWAALFLLFRLRSETLDGRFWARKIGSAVIMGFAISGMHYTGMAAAKFQLMDMAGMDESGSMNSWGMAYAIGLGTLVILGFVIVSAVVDRRLSVQSTKLELSELRYKSLFEHNPNAIFTIDLQGYFVEVNPAAEKLLGFRARRLVPALQFIPLAEETGLIVPIGEQVMRMASRQCKTWQEQGHRLRIGMDDFGTGYSSLSYLQKFPLDRLKIDQSFVRDTLMLTHESAIVPTIISMAHNLHLQVTAEGVETVEQLDYLREKLCDEAQGFLFSRPVPAEEFQQLLNSFQHQP